MPLKLYHEHPWDLTPKEAIQLQEKLKKEVIIQPLPESIELIGGLDVSYRGDRARAAFAGAATSGAPIDK
jgi:deoxyribonuclease V